MPKRTAPAPHAPRATARAATLVGTVTDVTPGGLDQRDAAWYGSTMIENRDREARTMLDARALPIARTIVALDDALATRTMRFEEACDSLATTIAAHVDWVHDMPGVDPNVDTAEDVATRWLGNYVQEGRLPLDTNGHI